MRRQSWIVIAVAALFGLVAVYLVNAYLSGADRQREAATLRTTRIAVARVPLEFGTKITPQNVAFVDWPAGSVPTGAFQAMEDLTPAGRTHVVLRPMVAGEPVLKSRLSGEGGRATLSALLDPTMRAAAIRISEVAGVAGFALPGDRVDVLLTRLVGEDEQVTEVLLQNARLIAIDQNANENSNSPNVGKTATLEVNPEDAKKLVLGGTVGTLSLVLRSVRAPQDLVNYDDAIRSSELAGGGGGGGAAPAPIAASQSAPVRLARAVPRPARPARPAPPRGASIEVVRGTAATAYEVRPYGGM